MPAASAGWWCWCKGKHNCPGSKSWLQILQRRMTNLTKNQNSHQVSQLAKPKVIQYIKIGGRLSFTQKSVGGKRKSINGKQYLKGHDTSTDLCPCWRLHLVLNDLIHLCVTMVTLMTRSHLFSFLPLPHFLNFLEISGTVYKFLSFFCMNEEIWTFKKSFIMKATVSSYFSLCFTSLVNTMEHKVLFQHKAL